MGIDTQGMTLPLDPNFKGRPLDEQQSNLKPATITPRRLFTDTYVKELKILINEVLDQREGKTGVSYFDTKHFQHLVGEEEPPYEGYK
tara:strand:+ start:31 stop:294 length:264 start_codon:yes stop_codon:yes gene_type:complete